MRTSRTRQWRLALGSALVGAVTVAVLINVVSGSNRYACYTAGRAEGKSIFDCLWAASTTEFADDFDEREFRTIVIGDTKESVFSKIGQPRHKEPPSEQLGRKGELWVYGNISWDSANLVFFVRNVEFDDAGNVARIDSLVYFD